MPAIGHVTKPRTAVFKGQLKTLSFRAPIDILPNTAKNGDTPARLSRLQPGRRDRRGLGAQRRNAPARTMCR